MSRKKWGTCLLLCFFGIMILLSHVVYSNDAQPRLDNSHYLFVMAAKQVKIIKTKRPSHYKIILMQVSPHVLVFTESPERDMGDMSVADVLPKLKEFGKQFSPEGLNAAIVEGKVHHKSKYVFTLYNPTSSSDHTIINFDAVIVPHKTLGQKPMTIQASTLMEDGAYIFIDACIGCIDPS